MRREASFSESSGRNNPRAVQLVQRHDGQQVHIFWKVANPADDVESWPEKPRTRFLQPDELLRFNDCLQSETHVDLKDFLTLAITTGARRSDIFSARWEDVKWERLISEVPFPKNGESYNVQLILAAFDVLKRRREEIPDGQAYVFPGRGNTLPI